MPLVEERVPRWRLACDTPGCRETSPALQGRQMCLDRARWMGWREGPGGQWSCPTCQRTRARQALAAHPRETNP